MPVGRLVQWILSADCIHGDLRRYYLASSLCPSFSLFHIHYWEEKPGLAGDWVRKKKKSSFKKHDRRGHPSSSPIYEQKYADCKTQKKAISEQKHPYKSVILYPGYLNRSFNLILRCIGVECIWYTFYIYFYLCTRKQTQCHHMKLSRWRVTPMGSAMPGWGSDILVAFCSSALWRKTKSLHICNYSLKHQGIPQCLRKKSTPSPDCYMRYLLIKMHYSSVFAKKIKTVNGHMYSVGYSRIERRKLLWLRYNYTRQVACKKKGWYHIEVIPWVITLQMNSAVR